MFNNFYYFIIQKYMATTPEDTSSEQPSEKTNTFIAPIIFAICIFIFVLLVLFIYGF